MSIQPISWSATYTANRDWLASLHGTDQTETITLDVTKLTEGTHYFASTDTSQPYSYVVSGIAVGRITESRLYGPYDPEATDGRQELAGHVLAETFFAPGAKRCPAALLWHGSVWADHVPGGIDPAKILPSSTTAQIRYQVKGGDR
ncbi:head decoration protein [Streptomyces sp. NPDC088925]|uniref:head decoration protein n=1 Tax=Streptomyces sp. NPDC088925 TaxID=3365914 RepID=UPI0037F5169B